MKRGEGSKVILFATQNMHKVEELRAVLGLCGYSVEPVDIPKVEIQSSSLETIAAYAAIIAYNHLGKPVVVEDAGLFIDALKGFPGPYSSYVHKTIGVQGILRLLEGVSERTAYFKSVIAYAGPWGVKLFTGIVRGRIAEEARGNQGFGFDPIFVPEGSSKTFAEMSIEEKNLYSHRARAASKLCEWLTERAVQLKSL